MTTQIIPRSVAQGLYYNRFEVQQQAPAGNWNTTIGTDRIAYAMDYAGHMAVAAKSGGNTGAVRIIDNDK
jgi:hypothetical protein